MKVAIYARVSTDDQRERESIQTQLSLVREYCAREGHQVIEEYCDDGVSGSIPLWLRPAGGRLLADVEARRFDAVVVYRTDRLGRQTASAFTALSMIESAGVAFISSTESYGSDPMGETMRDMNVVFASHERRVAVKRVTDAMYRIAKEGRWTGGGRLYGYRIADGSLALHEPEAAIIRQIYQWIAEQGISSRRIAERLNAMCIPTASMNDGRTTNGGRPISGKWTGPRVYNIATNPAYKGEYQYGRGAKHRREPVRITIPAIVSAETWATVQTILANNLRFSRRNAKHTYLLRGLIRCSDCSRMYHGAKRGSGKTYYRCPTRHSNQGDGRTCSMRNVNEYIEALIWDDIAAWIRDPGKVLDELVRGYAANGDMTGQLRTDIHQAEQTLAGKDAERDRIVAAFSKGILTESDLQRRLMTIRDEEATLTKLLSSLRSATERADERSAHLHDAETMLSTLRSAIEEDQLSEEAKRRVIETLVAGVTVEPEETIRVRYRFSPPIALLAGHR